MTYLNILITILVLISTCFALIANFKKANKKEVDANRQDVVTFAQTVNEEIAKLRAQNEAQQRLIETLQQQNAIEDQIIEEQYPNLEETLALLAQGQSTIIEWIKGIHDKPAS